MNIKDLKVEDVLIADGEFSCLKEGDEVIVQVDTQSGVPYITCSMGQHYLDGQISENGEVVGLRKK